MATLIHHQTQTEDKGLELAFFFGLMFLIALMYLLVYKSLSASNTSQKLLISIPHAIESSHH